MDKHSLSYTILERVYHIAWRPAWGKVPYGETGREIGEMLRMLAGHMDGVEIVEGTACVVHIHICIRIAPKHSGSRVVGRLNKHPPAMPRDVYWLRFMVVECVGRSLHHALVLDGFG